MVRKYLHEMSRLFVRKDGLLCRKIGAHEQAVLPKSFRRLIYKELQKIWDIYDLKGYINCQKMGFTGLS